MGWIIRVRWGRVDAPSQIDHATEGAIGLEHGQSSTLNAQWEKTVKGKEVESDQQQRQAAGTPFCQKCKEYGHYANTCRNPW
jgi:hypothetical protein